ncbi:MAG: hypothetical protein JXB39_09780 [Deltaproteobacteria bacterium]|nr:hypothetical protein [Deltaproteobacteria bacterium]
MTPRRIDRPGRLLRLAGALLAGMPLAGRPVHAAEHVAQSGNVEVTVLDPRWAFRAPPVARWLARELDAILPNDGDYRVRVRRRRLEGGPASVEDGVLVLDTAQPRPSCDEQLQDLTWALYAALLPGNDPAEAWRLAGQAVRTRYPDDWTPPLLPRCCPREDALLASGGPEARPPEPHARGHAPYAEAYGGVGWPPLASWPWAVGLAGLSVPLGRWSVAGAVEVRTSDLLEVRLGGGRCLALDPWSRVEAGPLVAFRPRGEAFPVDGVPEEAGAWVRVRALGLDVLGRAVRLPAGEGTGVAAEGLLRGRWELDLGGHAAVIPGVAGAVLAGEDPWRRPTLGALPGGVRWMSWEQDPADRVASLRLDAEAYLPVGRVPGPPCLRPRTLVARTGVDLGWSPPTGWVPGLAAAVGLSGNPWREVQGTLFLQLATPVDLSIADLSLWVSTRAR